jgi:hypothetical protein
MITYLFLLSVLGVIFLFLLFLLLFLAACIVVASQHFNKRVMLLMLFHYLSVKHLCHLLALCDLFHPKGSLKAFLGFSVHAICNCLVVWNISLCILSTG